MELSVFSSGAANDARAVALALFPLPSANDEGRTFRRYPLLLEAGVQIVAEHTPHRMAEVLPSGACSSGGLCYRSVLVCNLSLTGLYFLTTLPYRVECRMEIQLPLAQQSLNLPAAVRRLVPPASLTSEGLGKEYGCGVDFLYSQMPSASKQGLIDFLMQRFSPASVVPNKSRANLSAWASRRPL